MKFCNFPFLKQWLLYLRSFKALSLLAMIVLMTGILGAEAGEHREELPEGLDILIEDTSGIKRLFQEGTVIRLTEELYFSFSQDSYDRQIRIGDGDWLKVSGDSYRLSRKALYASRDKLLRISFRARDRQGNYRERSFFFWSEGTDMDSETEQENRLIAEAVNVDTQNVK